MLYDVPADASLLSDKDFSLRDKIKGTTCSIFLRLKDVRKQGKSSFNDSCCSVQNPNLRKTVQELCDTDGCLPTFELLQYFSLISEVPFWNSGTIISVSLSTHQMSRCSFIGFASVLCPQPQT